MSCGCLPNFSLWSSMYPFNYMTNYGGNYQFNTMPNWVTPQQAYGIQNVFNPAYYGQQFLNNIFSAFNPGMNVQQNMLNFNAYNSGWNLGLNLFNGNLMSNPFNPVQAPQQRNNSVITNIASLKAEINEALKSKEVPAEQKEQLKVLKKQLEKLEQRLQDLQQLQAAGASQEDLITELRAIQKAYHTIEDKAIAINEAIKEALGEDDEEEVDETDKSEKSEKSEKSKNKNKSEATSKISNVSETELGENIIGASVDDDDVREIANNIYKKVDGACSADITDYVKNNINKDNVVEVMLYWNNNYASTYKNDDALGMMETLFDERWIGGKVNVKPFVDALQEKLKDYKGIDSNLYDKASAQLAVADKEVNSEWCQRCDEDKASEAINKAHRAIVELMIKKGEIEQTEEE